MESRSAVSIIGRQLKSTSVLLVPHFYKDKSSPLAPGSSVQHSGPLLQLTGRNFLHPGTWKRRYCVLDSKRIFSYHLKEGARAYENEKTTNYIDLEQYDICEEAKGVKELKKSASHILVISSSEIEKSVFDTRRVYLSAESAAEMNEWISHIRLAMTSIREGRNSSPTPAPRRSKSSEGSRTSTVSTPKARRSDDQHELNTETATVAVVKPTEHLECVTRQRAKGPAGRRLPRHTRVVVEAAEMGHRSESLPRLVVEERSSTQDVRAQRRHLAHNRSFDMSRAPRASTLYAYSSSEESLSLPFIQTHQLDEEETVETLCEVPLISTSTPSLVNRRSMYKPSTVHQQDSTSADDPTDLPQQCQLLLQQTAAMKGTLAGLEVEFGASRRDLGWLQENLTCVRNAAGGVSEKVAKMQTQVAAMERQISSAVKEAQMMQQKATEALKSASDAERDFRRLENDCQAMLTQLAQRYQEMALNPVCLSPMTPPAFDFAALYGNPLKSSIRQNGENIKSVKSISFGPITTFTPPDEDELPSPVATSTLTRNSKGSTALIAS